MVGAELGDEVGGVLGSVDGKGAGDDEEGLRELADGELFAGADGDGEFFEVDVEGSFDGTAAGDDRAGFEGAFDGGQGVVHRALHFVELVVVAAAEDDGGRGEGPGAFNEDAFVVGDLFLSDFVGVAEGAGVEFLVAVEVGEGGGEGRAGGFGDAAQVFFFAAPDCHGAFFDELLEAEVVDAFGGEDDVGAGFEDHVDAFEDHGGFAGADGFELLGVVDRDVDAEFHAFFLEVHVQAGDAGVGDAGFHGLGGDGTVEGIAFEEDGLEGGCAVRFEDVDGFDGVFHFAARVGGLDGLHGVNGHVGEKGRIGSDDFAGHGRFSDVEKRFSAKSLDFDTDVFGHVLHSFAEGKAVACYYCCGMDAGFHEFVCTAEELSCDNDY